MSEQPPMPKLNLKLAPKPEEHKETPAPKPQVSPPSLGVPPAAAAQSNQSAGGTMPPPQEPVMTPESMPGLDATLDNPKSGGGGLNKILVPVAALAVGLGLGFGGAYFKLSSEHAAVVSGLEGKLAQAKKEADAKVATEQQKVAEQLVQAQATANDKLAALEQDLRQAAEEQIARKDQEIKALKASMPDENKIRASMEAQMTEMQQMVADAQAVAEVERKEKERLRHLAQQFQAEVKKYNPTFKPAPQPGAPGQ